MSHYQEKASPYNIILRFNGKSESYRVSKEFFQQIRKELQPFRSTTNQFKLIRCVETGEVFENAYKVMPWLLKNNIKGGYSACIEIRKACNGKIKSAYGFHWEYVAKSQLEI